MSFECVLLPDRVEPHTETSDGTDEVNVLDKIPSNGDVSSKVKPISNSRKYCCIPGCSSRKKVNRNNDKNISYHTFPTARKVNKLWKIKCRLLDKIPSTYVVCSKHFLASDYVDGGCGRKRMLLKNVVPSQNLPVASYTRKKNAVQMENRAQRLLNRHTKSSSSTLGEAVDKKPNEPKRDKKVQPKKSNTISSKPTTPLTTSIRTKLLKTIVKTKPVVNQTSPTPSSSSSRVNVMDLLNLKKRTILIAWTGIQTFFLLRKIEERVLILHPANVMINNLSVLECILLCFIRLKTKLSFVCLTSIFHLSASAASQTFQSMLPYIKRAMDDVDYFSSFIEGPDSQRILLRMYGYNEARAILDCTEEDEQNLRCGGSNDIVHSSTTENKHRDTKLNGTDLLSPKLVADNGQ